MKRAGIAIIVMLLVSALSICVLALCYCNSTCPSNRTGCTLIGDGGCWQTRYNRCEDGVCGLYDPQADNCQYGCQWKTYRCPNWPFADYECEWVYDYYEWCMPE